MKRIALSMILAAGAAMADAPTVAVVNLNPQVGWLGTPLVEVFITPGTTKYSGYTVAYACNSAKGEVFAGHAVLANLQGPTIDVLFADCIVPHVVVTGFVLDPQSQVSQ